MSRGDVPTFLTSRAQKSAKRPVWPQINANNTRMRQTRLLAFGFRTCEAAPALRNRYLPPSSRIMYSAVRVIAICPVRPERSPSWEFSVRYLNETITHLRARITLLKPPRKPFGFVLP